MNRNTKSGSIKKIVPSFILIFCVFTTIFGQVGNAPMQSLPQFPGPLSIDGFLQRQLASGGDWLPGPGGTTNTIFNNLGERLIPFCWRVVDQYNTSADEVFSKGYLQDDPNTMKWDLRRATSKTDLNNITLAAAINPGDNHVWLALSADRRSTGRNSSIDFEFLQHQVLTTGEINTGQDRGFYTDGPHGGRTIGDMVVSITFQNGGGSLASVSYLQWQETAFGYRYIPINPSAGAAFTAANPVEINVPWGAFGSTVYSPYTFVEAAIDVTALLGPPSACSPQNFKTIWVKSKSNDNFDDFYPPFQLVSTFGGLSVTYSFFDLYTAQLNASVLGQNPDDYNFHWTPIGATDGTAVDQTVTGTLNNYDIPNPIFFADTNYYCISYLYRVSIARKANPGCVVGETVVVINSPCKIGKPINPDEMQQGEFLPEEIMSNNSELRVFPNPARGSSTVTLAGNNSPKDIQLIDINGTVVQRWSGTTSNNLQLKNLPSGIYLLKVFSRTTGKTETKKIIVNN